jgi:hypothetical protein
VKPIGWSAHTCTRLTARAFSARGGFGEVGRSQTIQSLSHYWFWKSHVKQGKEKREATVHNEKNVVVVDIQKNTEKMQKLQLAVLNFS